MEKDSDVVHLTLLHLRQLDRRVDKLETAFAEVRDRLFQLEREGVISHDARVRQEGAIADLSMQVERLTRFRETIGDDNTER